MKLLRFFLSELYPFCMKYLIAGLGNIGSEYAHTRHNIGFEIVDALAAQKGITFQSGRYADTAEMKVKGKTLLLIKPTTYMNLSGKAVRYWMEKENIPPERVLVITDDLNLPTGKLRIRKKGSDGGHNGLKNITEILGSDVYARMRFGVGNNFAQGTQVQFVLGKWQAEELSLVQESIEKATQATLSFVLEGIDRAMNQYN